MQIGHFEKFLEMMFGHPSLLHEITHDSRYKLLTGVVSFVITVAVASCYGDTWGSPLLPLIATINTFSRTFDSCFGGRGPATVHHRSRVA
jgi:hypothetical protein